jgi:sulfite exporter TauE/SafE
MDTPLQAMAHFAPPLLFGLAGSVHCVGMCGGIVSALSLGGGKTWRTGMVYYHLGRIFTYSILGLILGFLGQQFIELNLVKGSQSVLALLSGLIIIFFSLRLAGWISHEFDPFKSIAIPEKLLRSAVTQNSFLPWLSVGLLNGLLPCGLIYAALALSLNQANPAAGMLTMAMFGLGTVPALFLMGFLVTQWDPVTRSTGQKIMALIMIGFGLILISRAGIPFASDLTHHHF